MKQQYFSIYLNVVNGNSLEHEDDDGVLPQFKEKNHAWKLSSLILYYCLLLSSLSIYGDIISLYGCIIELSQWQQLRAVKCKQLLGKISSFSPSHFLTCDWNEFQKYFSIISSASVCKEKKSKKNSSLLKKQSNSFIKNSKGINVNTLKR